MTFVQVIDFRTTDIDGMRQVNEQWRQTTEGKRTATRELIGRDRNDPGHYVAMVFFDSYESAMDNSALPETKAASQQYQQLSDRPPVFHDLEIVEDQA